MEFQNFMLLRKDFKRMCYDILVLLIKAGHFLRQSISNKKLKSSKVPSLSN